MHMILHFIKIFNDESHFITAKKGKSNSKFVVQFE